MRQTIYWVYRDGFHWKVQREGSDLRSAPHATQEAALGEARQLAHGEQPSLVKIRNPNGLIEIDLAYGT